MTPAPAVGYLRFAWWNVHDLAHFDPNRVAQDRWPSTQVEYDAKCARVDAALRDLIARHPPDILGLCEVTERAAEELRQRLFPGYEVIHSNPGDKQFQISILFRLRSGFRGRLALAVERSPRSTRTIPVVDHVYHGHQIRFVFCHWTAFGEHSGQYRQRAAETVAEAAYRFLQEPGAATMVRHFVVVGDLNEEPFSDLFRSDLVASRDRSRALQSLHHADRDVRRVRLYNPSWRLLGERHPHGQPSPSPHHAGTYFNERERSWHTYDQVLVSGGLLGAVPPFLDEAALEIMVLPGCLNTAGMPIPFRTVDGQLIGLSDHLPLVGQIVLPGS